MCRSQDILSHQLLTVGCVISHYIYGGFRLRMHEFMPHVEYDEYNSNFRYWSQDKVT